VKKSYFKNLSLVFLAAAIALSPSFSAGEIEGGRVLEIRIEDVLIVILGLVWIASFLISGRKNIKKPPLFLPILAWLGIGFFSLLTNWMFGNIGLSRGFFYFLKEIQFFFLYFYLFYHIRTFHSSKLIVNFWVFLGVANVSIVLFQLIQGFRFGDYGPGLFMERGPLPSGGFFLILFVGLFNVLLYYYSHLTIFKIKKGGLALCVMAPIIGVIASGSRTAILALVLAVILSLFLYQFKNRGLKTFFITLLVFIIIGGTFIGLSGRVPYILGISPERALPSIKVRAGIWEDQLSAFPDNLFHTLFGLGKSVYLTGEESHSQYVRNFIETGVVGSLLFFILIFAIMKKSWYGFSRGKNRLLIGLSAGLLVNTFVMLFISIAGEGFLVVKPNEVYWFFVAITMAVLTISKKKVLPKEKL